ncbi:hypothetical protein [Hyphobacterium marinum]|uniref:Uncharacterized protein n=1 Tax=Hyphobacterium marinum TaxID=3116574 RepID=A0ABU7LY67_9PROT|nr:hypothetical protein [Hyphobacterium sp. Y6023]MEE2566140.1 hypothetical protein [Hyphobacterium sp. Y6023]
MFGKLFGSRETSAEASPRRVYKAGWLLKADKASLIWDAPKPVSFDNPKPTTSKSASACPAAIEFDRRHFVIPCPVDLHLRMAPNAQGQLQLTNVEGPMASTRPAGLQNILMLSPQNEWRHPNRPMLQIVTPYIFVSDDPLYVNQFPPFLHYEAMDRPGVMLCGRFPADIWPRQHMWAFEWHDLKKDLILKRGEPLFYVRFEGPDPAAPVRLVEAEMTEDLKEFIASITDVTNYVNQSFQLFKTARERRPETLLVEKKRHNTAS